MTPRERCTRVLLRLLANPYKYTLRDLADFFDQPSTEGIKDDVAALRAAGLSVECKKRDGYKYAVLPDLDFKELKYLQPLSKEDRAKLGRALDFLSPKDQVYLKNKLESLYDFQQLGLRALRRPALERIDRLEAARKDHRQAILEDYRSNSGSISDRQVEPFYIDAELDTLQAYDLEQGETRHFLLSRIKRVHLTDASWQHEDDHRWKKTDVFRIANNRQEMVHLKLDVYAYNALVGAYPKALSEITPGAEPLTYDFQTMVNENFIGLLNFILGNAGMCEIEILGPEALTQKVRKVAEKIKLTI